MFNKSLTFIFIAALVLGIMKLDIVIIILAVLAIWAILSNGGDERKE